MPRAELRRLQDERLRATVARAARVELHRRRFADAGVAVDSVRGVGDLERLPFMRKSDFRDQYPFGLFAAPRSEVVRVHASSGTTGRPTVVGYTRGDLDVWAEVCARSLAAAGAQPGDVFQNAYGYGLFTGGLGMHAGGERLGLLVLPVSGGNTERQLLLIRDFRPAIVACTPSYALTLADAWQAAGGGESGIRSFVLGAEPWTEAMRARLEERWGAAAVNVYGLSEVIGPGVSNECVEGRSGSHVFEDHFLPEVVDPETGAPLPNGRVGELVFTSLTKEALPVVRYRTGDLCSLDDSPCPCGRTLVRMSRIVGRTDDMLIVRGINVFPTQIEAGLVGFEEVSPHYQIVVDREGHLDRLTVRTEVREDFFRAHGAHVFDVETERARTPSPGVARLAEAVRARLAGVTMLANIEVVLCAPGALPRSEGGKLRHVEDRRSG